MWIPYSFIQAKTEKCKTLVAFLIHVFSDRRSFQIRYAAFMKHDAGHAFKCLGRPYPATFIFLLFETPNVTLRLLAPRNTCCVNACIGEHVSLGIVKGTSQFMCICSWAGVIYLHYTVLMSPKKDKTAFQCCDPALSVLIMFGVSKRLSRSIRLAVYCLKQVRLSGGASSYRPLQGVAPGWTSHTSDHVYALQKRQDCFMTRN